MNTSLITREISYTTADGKTLVGFFVAPKSTVPVAGVLVGPEWWGRNDYAIQRATELAEKGYAALAMDMYGEKKTTEQASLASEWMTEVFQAPNTLLDRAQAALETLKQQPEVDATRLAAIGFCFGGKVALDLARAGAPLKAVISLHGNLSAQTPAIAGTVQSHILVLHGEKDSMVSLDDVAHFEQEMKNAHVQYQVKVLPNAKHGFSNPLADQRAKANGIDLAYNAEAEKDAIDTMYTFLGSQLA